MKTLLLTLLLTTAAFAQKTGTPVSKVNYPHDSPSQILFYDGSNNLIYGCYAVPVVNYTQITGISNNGGAYQWTVAATTLTNIVVSSNVGTVTTSTAHGLQVGNLVTVAGSATTALNGTYYVQTVGSTTTFTITTSGVANATYTTGLVLTTTAPLSSQPVWSIMKLTYSGTNLTNVQWANGAASSYNNICDNRAQTTGATKITYE